MDTPPPRNTLDAAYRVATASYEHQPQLVGPSLSLSLTPRWRRGCARNPHDRDVHPTPLTALTPRSWWVCVVAASLGATAPHQHPRSVALAASCAPSPPRRRLGFRLRRQLRRAARRAYGRSCRMSCGRWCWRRFRLLSRVVVHAQDIVRCVCAWLSARANPGVAVPALEAAAAGCGPGGS